VVWLPFDLHPEYPPDGIPREQLVARYGEDFHDHVRATFKAAGLTYNPPADVVPNSRAALRLTELARDRGRHQETHDRLMDAYWREGQNIGDSDVLRDLAADLDLPAEEVEDVLAGDSYLDRVEGSTHQAVALGVRGIPAWLLDRRLLVLGAQPREVFEEAFDQLDGA
jgi:predicted DsbA family dithiol-disulfide isomerase